MQGFFPEEELAQITKIKFDYDDGPNCLKCGLHRKCESPKMKYTGEGEKNVLIITDTAGAAEDMQSTHLIGDAGQLLRNELKALGLDLDRDFWKTNAISCRTSTPSGANRKPTRTEIKHCKPLVDKTIEDLNPSMIWLLGNVAVESMYIDRFSGLAINRWRKLCIPDRKTGKWVIPLFHPSDILKNNYDENLKTVFKQDLKWAVSCMKKEPFTWQDERDEVKCLYDFEEIIAHLKGLLISASNGQVFLYIDYETNALKPQWPGSKIATVSYCTDPGSPAIAFPYQYSDFFTKKQQTKIKFLWRKVITNPQVACIAHNIKFEDVWTKEIFGVNPYSWNFDTMLGAHIIDNRSKFSGLKFQSYINFGLEPYDKEIGKFLKSKTGHFNTVDKAPLDKLLLYNGLDTKMGMKLYHEQQKTFMLTSKLKPKNRLAEAYNLFHAGTIALADVQRNGICIDEDYYNEENEKIGVEIEAIKEKLRTSDEAALFKENGLIRKILDFGSTKDLGILFYDVLKLPQQLTTKNNYRVDSDALENINLPFVDDLLQMRKLEKVHGTYFAQFLREVCNKKIYPFFDLHIPVSFRGSSSMPNFQNIPIRDPYVGKLIRSGIFPSKGNKLAELDYASIEVKMAAIVTGDPNLKKYVLDPTTDMHRDSAQDIWMLPQEEVSKDIRKNSKGDWVFALLYGSFYKQCAISLWKHNNYETVSGIKLKDHMRDQGINNLSQFTEHCKEAERIFWQERFPVYAQWKIDINKKYQRLGWIENKFGFRFVGYMSDKQVSNFPVQSAAFHTLLHSIILINDIAKEEKWKSKLVGQIHDSLVVDLVPEEEKHVLETCVRIMSIKMRELHDWIDVPIDVDAETTDIDKPWSTKKEVKISDL